MKKGNTLWMAFITVLIIALLAFTAYLTIFMRKDESTDRAASESAALSSPDGQAQNKNGPDSSSIDGNQGGNGSAAMPEHRFIFVGDSRTVGMQEAVKSFYPEDRCMFDAKSGEGYVWFRDTGMAQLESFISEAPDCPVILNLGVNDYKNINEYIELYQELFSSHPDTDFYIMSVNPVMDELCPAISNKIICDFNDKMKESFPDRYLDCYTYLLSTSLETMDGLHYTENTYIAIHDYVVGKLGAGS
ncbi:SGNH/GDSL hydrolase family protein [Murimonas intestini]|nr:SGNH/GDSL hydrolase family protein [Murimonas intestini]MCR1842696.1 SGNH/GDSL hydrolase family protein [Murimonas intestini]MCR1867257.1 SGNH/GDSL hydrolase family protein [Murimonas intestini]MCR1884443.1 SGNH/GDSL hydrolase family protein [Murimonas intestini]